MLRKSDHSLLLEVKASKIFASAIQITHTLALIVSIISSIPGWNQAMFCLFIIYSFNCNYKKHVIQAPKRLLAYTKKRGWRITCNELIDQPITILDSSVITPMLTVLQFIDQNHRKQSIIVISDALNKESYRQMCITLKIATTTY